jgi:hypothetical protein
MPITPVQTPISPILDAIKAQLVARNVHTPDHIFMVAVDDPPHTMGDSDILLRPMRISPTQPKGAGRVERRVRRLLKVIVRTRLALDEVDRDFAWLEDASLGHFVMEEAVVNWLDTFQPTDGSGNALTFEPLDWVPSSQPEKEKADSSWGRSELFFEIPYILTLDQSLQ